MAQFGLLLLENEHVKELIIMKMNMNKMAKFSFGCFHIGQAIDYQLTSIISQLNICYRPHKIWIKNKLPRVSLFCSLRRLIQLLDC